MKANTSITRAAVLLSGGLLLLMLFSILALRFLNASPGSSAAYIYQDGILLQIIDLSTVTEEYELTLETEDGGSNTLLIRPGEIGVVSASCPDRICVKQGFLSDSLLPITCLPNRLVIQLRDTSQGTAPDSITY